MGADIYLKSLSEPCKAKWEPEFHAAVAAREALPCGSEAAIWAQNKVSEAYEAMYAEGYFRDSYNSFALFPQLGLSWWRDVKTDKKGFLSIARAKRVRKLVANAKLDLRPQVIDAAIRGLESYPLLDEAAEAALAAKLAKRRFTRAQHNKIEDTRDLYEKERASLLALLDKSIELGEPLECSL